MDMKEPAYLGDGVYATFDGWQIALKTTVERGEQIIYVDDAVFAALIRFAVRSGADPVRLKTIIDKITKEES